MAKLLSVGPQEVKLLEPPIVQVTDTDFHSLAKSDAQKVADGIGEAGLGKLSADSLTIGPDGTVKISDEAVFKAVKERLEGGDVVIFGNTGCLNIICFTF